MLSTIWNLNDFRVARERRAEGLCWLAGRLAWEGRLRELQPQRSDNLPRAS